MAGISRTGTDVSEVMTQEDVIAPKSGVLAAHSGSAGGDNALCWLDLAQPIQPVARSLTGMSERDHDDPRLDHVHRGVWEGTDEHAAHALGQATVFPGWAGQRLLVDSCERCLSLRQEALAEPRYTIVIP